MKFLENDNVISQIKVALQMPAGSGTPTHKNRPTHGLSYNVNHVSTYKFSDGTTLTVNSGDCIFIPQNSSYVVTKNTDRCDKNSYFYAINFISSPQNTYRPQVFHVRGKAEVESLFLKATVAWRKKNVGFYEETFSDLYKIIKILKKENLSYAHQSKITNILSPAINYINENYTVENIRISKLAQLCNVSQPYLRKLFDLAFSVSPAVYMRNLRINYAKELINSGEYSIADVSFISGFSDVSYFSREFKKSTGLTPKDYANKTKNGV